MVKIGLNCKSCGKCINCGKDKEEIFYCDECGDVLLSGYVTAKGNNFTSANKDDDMDCRCCFETCCVDEFFVWFD